jgi:hypothetical protein
MESVANAPPGRLAAPTPASTLRRPWNLDPSESRPMPSRLIRAGAGLLAAALLLAAPPARADVSVGDVRFVEGATALGEPVQLKGTGLFRWKWVVKVYAAAFYLPAGVDRFEPADDVARRLEFNYLVGIQGSDFGPAADKLLARNFPEETLAPLRDRIERLHATYVDVKPGDRYALSYLPGQGTELTLNGRRLALVEGADFARVYFAIWLGQRPLDDGMRDRLLARND